MRFRPAVGLLLLIPLSAAGCARSPIPAADQIAAVELSVHQFPGNTGKPPCKAKLTERADIAEVVAWLKAIDWSQSGTDLTVVSMPAPDGGIRLIPGDGEPLDFGFYWGGGFVHTRANRLIKGGDMAKLKQIVQKACKG
jgi:hypothetical protein